MLKKGCKKEPAGMSNMLGYTLENAADFDRWKEVRSEKEQRNLRGFRLKGKKK